MPVVSIIIPTFNRAALIRRAIKSVLGQIYGDFELIVVDDGSTDKTEEVVAGFGDKRIRYIRHEHNQGQNAALNTGVREAVGQYVAFLDSDDEWLPQFLDRMLFTFDQDPSLGAVYSRAYGCSNSGELREGYQFHLQGHIYKEALSQGYLSYMITIVVKKEIIDLLTPSSFDPSFIYGQDDDFCFRVAKLCRIGLIAEPLAIIYNDGDIQGGEASICTRHDLIADGREKLLDKYKDDIRELCGIDVLASKYLSCAKLYLRVDKIEKARLSFVCSYNIKKSFLCMLYLLYCHTSFLRWSWERAMGLFRFFKK